MNTRAKNWQVTATISYKVEDTEWVSTVSIPRFVLPIDLGICSKETAHKVACSIIDPMNRAHTVTTTISELWNDESK